MRMNKGLLIFLASIAAVVGIIVLIVVNIEPPLTYGTIYNKEFVPYREWTTQEETCISMGQNMPSICTPYTAHHSSPDTWYVYIAGTNDNGTELTRRIKIPKELFDVVEINADFFVPGEQGDN